MCWWGGGRVWACEETGGDWGRIVTLKVNLIRPPPPAHTRTKQKTTPTVNYLLLS